MYQTALAQLGALNVPTTSLEEIATHELDDQPEGERESTRSLVDVGL